MIEKINRGIGCALLCPSCGGTYLRHNKVSVFSRAGEDSETGAHVVVYWDGSLSVDDDMTDNPSRRRDGILISLECETCEHKPVLYVRQHEGETFLEVV